MLDEYYLWIKAIHVIMIISWMVGMLYLPRLYVYHAQVEINSPQDYVFRKMEQKLLRVIMNPAMILSIIFGLLLANIYGWANLTIWFHLKMGMVVILAGLHGLFAKWRKDFAKGENKHTATFYRIINEIPTIAMIIAIIMVIVKPFE